MKSLIKIALLSLALVGILFGQVNMANTKHDLTYSSNDYYTANEDQICVFCHTPHKAASNDLLWQRSVSFSASFTTFDAGTQTADSLEYESRACLSCHDGTTAFNTLANAPGSGGLDATITMTGAGGSQISSGAASLGQDLRDDHPIGIPIPSGTGWKASPTSPVFGASNTVECASCHDPHEGTNAMFLRIANTGSALCIDCHDK